MLIQDSVKNLICNGFEFTKSKNGYKNTRELTYLQSVHVYFWY